MSSSLDRYILYKCPEAAIRAIPAIPDPAAVPVVRPEPAPRSEPEPVAAPEPKATPTGEIISDREWLLTICRAVSHRIRGMTFLKAAAIAKIIAAENVPWPRGMTTPDGPQMVVGQIMKRLFTAAEDDRISFGRFSVCREMQHGYSSKKQENFTWFDYCFDDEENPDEF